ncbi:hypothetical protein HGRIS_003957 [Hohenbuehelia grisea]|uniref:THUMP domain-containing protein n=1 Tax=Hohenbuehelia grisea TaxID=104357 RepID=A0ABR3JH19_9AGAR
MAPNSSASSSRDGKRSQKKYRPRDGADWTKRTIDGPGIWVTCVKGKEKQTVGELYDLFERLASELWPLEDSQQSRSDDREDDEDLSVEDEIARELASMKKPRRESRFANCQTNTPCAVFISCKKPVDPVKLVVTHIENVKRTGVSHTKYVHRLVPVSGTSLANPIDIERLCEQVYKDFFAQNEGFYRYKVELRIRNHNTHLRADLIQNIVKNIPAGHTVDLSNPEIFILVEVFKVV